MKRIRICALCLVLALCLSGCQIPGLEFLFGGDSGPRETIPYEPPTPLPPETDPVETEPPATVAPTLPPETTPPAAVSNAYCVDAAGGLNVRSGPGQGYGIVGRMDNGTTVYPEKIENGWAYITAPFTGWCSASYLKQVGVAEGGSYWVWADGGLNVRSGPGKDYKSIGMLQDFDVITPVTWENGWAYIERPYKGWLSGECLYPLGWYGDVRMPVGKKLDDTSLVGKWMYHTAPDDSPHHQSCAGYLQLNNDGTFDQIGYTLRNPGDGDWYLPAGPSEFFVWRGEYHFDGSTLILNYMVYMISEANESGVIYKRTWKSELHTVSMWVSRSTDRTQLYIGLPGQFPVSGGPAFNPNTSGTFYKLLPDASFPNSVLDKMNELYF